MLFIISEVKCKYILLVMMKQTNTNKIGYLQEWSNDTLDKNG